MTDSWTEARVGCFIQGIEEIDRKVGSFLKKIKEKKVETIDLLNLPFLTVECLDLKMEGKRIIEKIS